MDLTEIETVEELRASDIYKDYPELLLHFTQYYKYLFTYNRIFMYKEQGYDIEIIFGGTDDIYRVKLHTSETLGRIGKLLDIDDFAIIKIKKYDGFI